MFTLKTINVFVKQGKIFLRVVKQRAKGDDLRLLHEGRKW
jgi:hypothetical protein